MFDRLKSLFRAQAYEGASTGGRSKTWAASNVGPNSALNYSLSTLRARSRQAYRNNPWIERAISRNVSNEIGAGIKPIFESSDSVFNDQMSTLWDDWTKRATPDGVLDFHGILSQASRTRRLAGEVFIRVRYRRGGKIPMQLQVLEPDHVPETLNETRPNGNTVVAGVEFNRVGQRVAYWMYPNHPNDNTPTATFNSCVRVPAADVIHHYAQTRPGQVRGEPDIVQALLRAQTYDKYENNELVRKETKSIFTGFLKKDYSSEEDWQFDPITGEAVNDDAGLPDVTLEPGVINVGAMGESLDLHGGDDTGAGYADFQKQQQHAIAAGCKSLYQLTTGDWSGVNDRIYRAMIQEYRRELEAIQDHLVIHQICEKVGLWFTEAAILNGVVTATGYALNKDDFNRRDWRTHRWPHIHPTQDVNATILEIENDLESHDAAVAKRGYRAGSVQESNVKSRKRKQDLEADNGVV
ncbi:MAG: phage portal protein [Pontibacterium sp.]